MKHLLIKKRRSALRGMLICMLCCLSMAMNAKTWTIGTGGDFVDINAAMSSSSVVDGDELQFLPKTVLNTQQTVTKAVTITGTGYLNDDESRLDRENNYNAFLIIESDDVTIRQYRIGWVQIHGANTHIEHCYIDYWIDANNSNYDTDDTVIRSCFIGYGIYGYQMFAVINTTGWTITNCIIGGKGGAYKLINLSNAIIDHNIIYSPYKQNTYLVNSVKNSTLTNNIIVCDGDRNKTFDTNSLSETNNSNIIRNNIISNTTALSRFPDNVQVANLAAVCTLEGGSSFNDTYYRLLASSPAKGYATDGGDCGPWSGPYPYVIGGITSGTEPMVGNYKLDLNAVDTPSAGVFQSLLSLFTAMATNGIGSQISVSVADGDYDLNLDDSTYPVLQAFGEQVTSSTGTISMAAPTQATFNIKASALFLLGHYTEISAITSIIKERISLTHITVTVNGTPVIYDEFQVEANDLLALKNMYNAWGGTNWTTKKWSFENNGHSKDDFPGVTFDDNGRVTAIDLENNNLVGETFDIYSPQLSEVTSLNLSRNKLTGDISKIVPSMTKLQMLNLSYNRLTELTDPSAIASSASVNLKSQNRVWKDATDEDKMLFTDNFYSLIPTVIKVSKSQPTISVPTLFTYDWEKLIYLRQLYAPEISYGNVYSYNSLSLDSPYQVYMLDQDTLVAMVFAYGTYKAKYSAYPAILHYEEGDADMTGETNVLDVQYMLNYILAPSTISYFNYSAANTYADQLINVQDIVKTVNIILNQPFYLYSRHKEKLQADMSEEMDNTATPTEGTAYTENGQIKVNAQKDLSAIDIELEGVTVDQVGLMLNQRDFQMIGRNTEWGCRFIIFSPTGKSIPADSDTALLRLSSQATLVGIQCSDPKAQEVLMTVTTAPTGIRETIREKATDDATYDLNGRRLTNGADMMKGIYVRQGQKFIVR